MYGFTHKDNNSYILNMINVYRPTHNDKLNSNVINPVTINPV